MLRTKNFGRKSLNEIKEILCGLALGFGMKPDASGKLVLPGSPGGPPLLDSLDHDVGEDLNAE